LFYLEEDAATADSLMAVDVRTDGPVFEAGIPRSLFKTLFSSGNPNTAIGPNTVSDSYAVSADGKRFVGVVAVGRALEEPITVVLNWTAAFKK
jgi:hypothetical protein